MLKKTITYTDYNNVERTEDFYFNFSEAEVMEMEMGVSGGLSTMINRIIATQETPELIKLFKDIILKAYGIKSPDGKYFQKTPELSAQFSYTEAYSILYSELATNAEAASKFVNSIIPTIKQKTVPSAGTIHTNTANNVTPIN